VGNILIALNPYQTLNIYSEEIMNAINRSVKAGSTGKPHVFTIAANALSRLMADSMDQSVLISGESGAG
jgi:myosin heavy subunit